MRKYISQLIDELTGRFGFHFRVVPLDDVHPVDVRDTTCDPRSFLYTARCQPVLIDAPVSRAANPTELEDGALPWIRRPSGVLSGPMPRSSGEDDGIGKPPIDATALVRTERNWAWLPTGDAGRRRVAALTTADGEMVSIRLWRVIYREDVRLWPRVASGEFGPDEALRIFDRMFERQSRPSRMR